jgi:hypothetical protein
VFSAGVGFSANKSQLPFSPLLPSTHPQTTSPPTPAFNIGEILAPIETLNQAFEPGSNDINSAIYQSKLLFFIISQLLPVYYFKRRFF